MKKTKKQKPNNKRAKKQKRTKGRRDALPKILRIDEGLREALNHRHPLTACRITEGWQDHGMAVVIIVRQAPTGQVYSAFLIDLLGLGLKDVTGNYGLTVADIGKLDMGGGKNYNDLVPCDYQLVSDLVYGGLAWARKYHFRPPKDYKVWIRLLEPRAERDVDLTHFGSNGEPLFILEEDDLDQYLEEDFDLRLLSDPISAGKAGVSKKVLKRLANIKSALITYSRREEFREDFDNERKKRFGRKRKPEEKTEWINFQDWFVLEYRNDSGDGIIDYFLKRYQNDMSHDVLALIKGWKQVFEGIFEIREILIDGFLVKNLINERDYRVFITNEEQSLAGLHVGDFLVGRIAPALGFHVFSGGLNIYPASKDDSLRAEMYRTAARMQIKNPKLALRDNPEKLQQSREAVQRQYGDFLECFGGEEVLGSGKEILKHFHYFFYYQMFEKKDPESGLTKAEEYQKSTGQKLKALKPDLPQDVLCHEDAAMLCDPVEAITVLMEYGLFLDIFKDPEKHLGQFHAEDIIMGYLESDTISDVPFRRAAQRFPRNFYKVFLYYKNQKGFSASTLEELMQEFKPWSYAKLPGIVAIANEEIVAHSKQMENTKAKLRDGTTQWHSYDEVFE